jgi:hypothetical protein
VRFKIRQKKSDTFPLSFSHCGEKLMTIGRDEIAVLNAAAINIIAAIVDRSHKSQMSLPFSVSICRFFGITLVVILIFF